MTRREEANVMRMFRGPEYTRGPETYLYLWPLMTGSNDIAAASAVRPT